tara:strand:- start:1692 stop:2600 length:909 start_codon:yes stop_codon:yes gene_type:complete
MGSQPWPLLIVAVMLLSLAPASANQTQANTAQQEGLLMDVAFMSTDCLENATCEAHRPAHLIEYFSADWCEPCVQVGESLDALASNQTVVLQHHPSPQDLSFFSDSKQRNDADYRLLFFPSIVLDGTHLFTGTRQSMDLVSTMENETNSWQGLENVSFSNNTLRWNASISGTVVVWALTPTPHEVSGKVHRSVAYERFAMNASAGELVVNASALASNTSMVILLEQEGVRNLTVASLAPTGAMDLIDNTVGTTSGPTAESEIYLPALVSAFLVFMLLPAIITHLRLTRANRTKTSTDIGSEE